MCKHQSQIAINYLSLRLEEIRQQFDLSDGEIALLLSEKIKGYVDNNQINIADKVPLDYPTELQMPEPEPDIGTFAESFLQQLNDVGPMVSELNHIYDACNDLIDTKTMPTVYATMYRALQDKAREVSDLLS